MQCDQKLCEFYGRGLWSLNEYVAGRNQERRRENLEVVLESLERVSKSTFWRWDYGSSTIFRRWPGDIMKEFWDRCDIFMNGKLTRFTKKQQVPIDTTEF